VITVDQLPPQMQAKIRLEDPPADPYASPVPGPCWTWTGGKTTAGYGVVRIDAPRPGYVHRLSYTLLVGPISDGLHTDHLCRNRACCNPSHLEPVTPRVNILRGEKAQKPECANGHPLEGDNLVWSKEDGRHPHRRCRTCYYQCHRESHKRHGEKWNATRRAKYQPRRDPNYCGNGHEWSEANTRITSRGHRLCRQCERDRKRRWRESRQAVAA
jgi:hypothetical protein